MKFKMWKKATFLLNISTLRGILHTQILLCEMADTTESYKEPIFIPLTKNICNLNLKVSLKCF